MGGRVVKAEENVEEIREVAEKAELIAKGKVSGYVFNTLADLELWLEDENKVASLNQGDNLYIRDTSVPDYWWDGNQKCELETQKVDLTDYVKNTDYADRYNHGVFRTYFGYGLNMNSSGDLMISHADKNTIDEKKNVFNPITSSELDYATMKALTDCKLEGEDSWTPERQQSAKDLLGVNDIKTIQPKEDGSYFFHILDMEDGLYSLPIGTTIQYRKNGASLTTNGNCQILITTDNNGWKLFELQNNTYGNYAYGYENETYGVYNIRQMNYMAQTNVEQTFIKLQKMSAPLPLDDHSDNIPNTEWVNDVISANKEVYYAAYGDTSDYEGFKAAIDKGSLIWCKDNSRELANKDLLLQLTNEPLDNGAGTYIINFCMVDNFTYYVIDCHVNTNSKTVSWAFHGKNQYAFKSDIINAMGAVEGLKAKNILQDNAISILQTLTKGFGGGGINGNDIPANGTWNLVPNTIVICTASEKNKLQLVSVDASGNESVVLSGMTGLLFISTILDDAGKSFNIHGVGYGGSSIFAADLEKIRHNVTSRWYIKNTSTTSDVALYRLITG